ncbi:MAG TPA: MFS transporter [Gaiellaceae bacterium]|nr:MFS transporter [Gaiellaceae bacterium]
MIPLRKNRDFILLQVGQTLSTIGSQSTQIAYPLLVLALTHSPARAGIVGFAVVVPWAIFGFGAGVLADRAPRRRVMVTSDAVRIVAVTSVIVAIAVHHLTFAHVALVAFLEGTMFVFFNVAEFGALRSVVSTVQLPRAVAAEQARYSTVQLVGPPLGGALFGLGRALPFVANATSVLFSLGSILSIRTPFQEAREATAAEPLRSQLAEGLRWLWGRPFLRTCALLFTTTNLIYEGLILVMVVVGRKQGLSSGEIGGLIAAFGACSLVGSAIAPTLQRLLSMRAIIIASVWVPLSIAFFLLAPSVYVLLAVILPMMLFIPTTSATVIGYRVAVVPDRLTGRVNSAARTIALCGAPLGPLSAGLLLSATSPRVTIAVYSLFLVVPALIGTWSPSIRNAPSLDELGELPTPEVSPAAIG